MIKIRFVFFSSLLFCFLGTLANANGIICSGRNINVVINVFSRNENPRKVAEAFYPPYVRITDDFVQFGLDENRWYKPEKNIGYSYAQAQVIRPFRQKPLFKLNYKKGSKTLVVTFTKHGVQRPQPLSYQNCEELGSASGTKRSNSNTVAAAFKKLRTCDRKYVQQFLKGQELYSGTIDGKWGQNTHKGLVRAGKAGKLKRKTPSEIIELLSDNLVCP